MRYYKREFLNKKEGTACYAADITVYSGGRYMDGSFTITDCNRQVSLDFSFHDNKSKERILDKADRLINALIAFKLKLASVELNCEEDNGK